MSTEEVVEQLTQMGAGPAGVGLRFSAAMVQHEIRYFRRKGARQMRWTLPTPSTPKGLYPPD